VDRGRDDQLLRDPWDSLLHIPPRLRPGVQGGAGDGGPPRDGGARGERRSGREDEPDPGQGPRAR